MITLTISAQVRSTLLPSRLALAAVLILTTLVSASAQSVLLPGPGGASAPPNLLNGLLAYWKFDEVSGTAVADASGNGYDGIGTSGLTRVAGIINKSVAGNGASSIAVAKSFGALNDLAFSCWLKTISGAPNMTLFNISDPSFAGSYIFIATASSGHVITAEIVDSVGMDFAANGLIHVDNGIWHHLAVTKNGNTLSIYIDGQLDVAVTHAWTTITLLANEATILVDPFTDYFTGSVDEAAFWSRGLTVAEITALYNSGSGRQYPFN